MYPDRRSALNLAGYTAYDRLCGSVSYIPPRCVLAPAQQVACAQLLLSLCKSVLPSVSITKHEDLILEALMGTCTHVPAPSKFAAVRALPLQADVLAALLPTPPCAYAVRALFAVLLPTPPCAYAVRALFAVLTSADALAAVVAKCRPYVAVTIVRNPAGCVHDATVRSYLLRSHHFLFELIRQRNVRLVRALVRHVPTDVARLRDDGGRTALDVACDGRGLTQNLLRCLRPLFPQGPLPHIRNRKARAVFAGNAVL
jgi:hypothetical protein